MNEAVAQIWASIGDDGRARLEAVSAALEPTIGLTKPSPLFRMEAGAAILAALGFHLLDPPPKRWADIRKDRLQAANDAARGAQALLSSYDRVGIPDMVYWAREAAVMAVALQRQANELRGKDKGGRSRKAAAEMLVDGLADAFETTAITAAIRVNARQGTAKGPFLDLVEAAMRLTAKLAKLQGRKLDSPPSRSALAELCLTVLSKRRERLHG